MKRILGSALLGLALVGGPVAMVGADEIPEEIEEMAKEDNSTRNWIIAAIVALVVIGGGIAATRKS